MPLRLPSVAAGAARADFDLVMFDLDGTLLDTAPEITEAVNAVLKERGLRPAPERQVRTWIGHGSSALMRQALAFACEVPAAAIAEASLTDATNRYWDLHQERLGERSQPFPDVVRCLCALVARGTALAVVSNKEQQLVEGLLRRHALRAYFGLVIGGDTLASKKPDPLPLRHCLQHFGTAPGRALYVADAALDVACARAAGVACWIVRHGYESAEAIATAQPDRLIDGCGIIVDELARADRRARK